MYTLTLELNDALAHSLEECARREHKPLAAWACERLHIASLESEAEANGYPPDWLKLFGSIDDDPLPTLTAVPKNDFGCVPDR
jgi:hypothetical protein